MMIKRRYFSIGLMAVLTIWGCDGSKKKPAIKTKAVVTKAPTTAVKAKSKKTVTLVDAKSFMQRAEKELLAQMIRAERTAWIKSTYITVDTQSEAAIQESELGALITKLATEATKFSKLELPEDLARKFKLLRLAPTLPAPKDAKLRKELADTVVKIQGLYGKGKYCPEGKSKIKGEKKCYDLGDLSERLAKSRNYDELLEIWRGWRSVSAPMRKDFTRYVELANQGASVLGFKNTADLWKSRFDLEPKVFEEEVDRLWNEVKPLYDQLHCYVRSKLAKKYGKKKVPLTGPIPAHLLGNMWGQDWAYISDLVMPKGTKPAIDLSSILKKQKYDEVKMVKSAENFFVSLGMDPLPKSFWKRSMLKKPADRDVVCHASAWDIDYVDDLRIKMCIKINEEDFTTIHHELGHIFYFHYYKDQSPLFRDSANKGFHEGLGDTIALSVTPKYLKEIGLIDKLPKTNEIQELMPRALEKIAFLPFGLLIDKWRWDVFSGKVKPEDYNKHWWKLREQYQGVAAPFGRTEKDFDPGAKYHVAGNVPYIRYFLAAILQFQFHRALCKRAMHEGPLHQCSIYNNKEAGKRLMAMMELGLSKPWPKALKELTGEEKMDATAIISYFQPLMDWLKKENKNQKCGW